MQVKITRHFTETSIARNIPYAFNPGEIVDVPDHIAEQWLKAHLAVSLVDRECAAVETAQTAVKTKPRRKATRS